MARSPPTCAPLTGHVTQTILDAATPSKQVSSNERLAPPEKLLGIQWGDPSSVPNSHWPSTCHCGTSFCARAMSPSKNAAARGGGGHGGGKPTHFLAVRLSPASVHLVRKLQTHMGSAYASFFVHPQTAHVTLGVIGLYDDASIDAACMRMEQEVTSLKLGAPKLVVGEHVGGFRKQVLYLGVRDDDNVLQSLRDAVLPAMHRSASLEAMNNEGSVPPTFTMDDTYTPHLTVAKASRNRKGAKSARGHKRKKDSEPILWFDARDTNVEFTPTAAQPPNPTKPLCLDALGGATSLAAVLGESAVEEPSELQLCSLFAQKDEEGYYHVTHRVPFTDRL